MLNILTRWLRGYRGHRAAIKRVEHRIFQEDFVPYQLEKEFNWPDITELQHVQA